MAITSTRYVTTDENIKKYAPKSKGVYALYSKESVLIYYGMSDNDIQGRLLRHNNGDEGSCTKSAWYFNFEETSYPITRERELLEGYKKANSNKLPRCNEVMP